MILSVWIILGVNQLEGYPSSRPTTTLSAWKRGSPSKTQTLFQRVGARVAPWRPSPPVVESPSLLSGYSRNMI